MFHEMIDCNESKSCNSCKKRMNFSWMPVLLVAILPKCPFCVMAYSGAVSLCSGNMLYPNAGGTTAYISIGLALIVLLGIMLNYKGKKTWVAMGLTLLGISLLVVSQFYKISIWNYYLAVLFMFFGIWYNGSFSYFYKHYFKHKLSKF